jgi:hypothetical protein
MMAAVHHHHHITVAQEEDAACWRLQEEIRALETFILPNVWGDLHYAALFQKINHFRIAERITQ